MAAYPHTLNLNLTIAGEGETWNEVMILLKDTEASWEVTGLGRTFLEAIANLVDAIEQMSAVPSEVKAQLLMGGIQLSVMPWGDGSAVQGNENPLDAPTSPAAEEWAEKQGAIAESE